MKTFTDRKELIICIILFVFTLFNEATQIQAQNNGPCNAVPLNVNVAEACTLVANQTNSDISQWIASGINPMPSCGGYNNGEADAWYSFVAPLSGVVVIQTFEGSLFEGALAVYGNTGGCNGSFTEISCKYNNGIMPQVILGGLMPLTTYYIRFWEAAGNAIGGGTTYSICIQDGAGLTLEPEANFEASSVNLCPGAEDTVVFINTSNTFNIPTTWNWSFPGGTPSSSTAQHPPVIQYTTPGTYDVSLILSSALGTDTLFRPNYISVVTPTADFTATRTLLPEGCHTTFTDLSTCNPISWSWSFPGGEPSSSSLQSPTVLYNASGTYEVMLTVSTPAGTVTKTKTNYISVYNNISLQSLVFSTKGTDFWLAFRERGEISIAIGSDVATNGIVTCPGIGFSAPFTVIPFAITVVNIPGGAAVGANQLIQDMGIHVTANDSITVTAQNMDNGSSDASVILTTGALGKEYIICSYGGNGAQSTRNAEGLIVATQSATTVTIIPKVATLGGDPAGIPFNITLNQGQTYLITGSGDITGTRIIADKPLNVFGSNPSTNVPVNIKHSDHLYEQLLPIDYWGTEYISVRLLGTPAQSNFYRVIASQNGTEVRRNGILAAILNQGDFFDFLYSSGVSVYVVANKPIAVLEFAIGLGIETYNQFYALPPCRSSETYRDFPDPFMMLLLPTSIPVKKAIFTTSRHRVMKTHYVSVTAKTTNTAQILLDGAPFPGFWTPISGSPYSSTGAVLTGGVHTLTSLLDSTFNAYVYGWPFPQGGCLTSYGYFVGGTGEQFPPLALTIDSAHHVKCQGGNDGAAFASISGGTPPYFCSWSPEGGNNTIATGLSAGTYIVTVSDDYCNSVSDTVTITEPPPLLYSFPSITDVSCFGNNNGSAVVDVSGGIPPYSYEWSTDPPQFTDTATGLHGGTFYITIRDFSCTILDSVLINEPDEILLSTSSIMSNCGQADGEACVTVSGGIAPYNFQWDDSNNQTDACAINIPSEIYNVTVTDNNNCAAAATAIVNDINGPEVIIESITHVSCNGGNDGAIDISATGATIPFTFSWSNGDNTEDISGLFPGIYFLTVADANDCNTSIIAEVLAPAEALSAQFSNVSPVRCNGESDGSISIAATGGTGDYIYEWFPQVSTDSFATGLNPDVYTVTITDDNGCFTTIDTTVTEPEILEVNMAAVTNVSCNGGSDGAINVAVTGGTAAYSYFWTNHPGTTANINDLTADNYSVTVTDANGCTAFDNATVSEPSALSIVIDNVNHLICPGGNDGAIDITVSGGTPAYTYSWSNQETADISDLTAGPYSVTVTDANGCSAIVDTILTEPEPIAIEFIDVIHVSCFGGSNGSVTANVSGGTGSYTYTWDPPVGSGASATGISKGVYNLLIRDDNGCEQLASVTINERDSLIVAVTGSATICEGESAVLEAIATGGTDPYTYNWTPGAVNVSSFTVSPPATTTYTVSVTDENNCPAVSSSLTVTVNALPTVSFTADLRSGCAPLCVLFSNQTPDIGTVNWDFDDGQFGTETAITHCYIDPGIYSVSLAVTDSKGCMNSLSAPDLINVLPNPVASFSMTPPQSAPVSSPVLFNDQSVGADHWFWNFGDFLNSASMLKNPTFTYSVTGSYQISLAVTNNEGCMDTITQTIIIEPEFTLYIPNAFTPDDDGLNDFFGPKGAEFDSFEMEIYNRWGERIYHTTDVDKPWDGRNKNGDEIQEGVYVYKIRVKDFKEEMHYYIGNVTLIR